MLRGFGQIMLSLSLAGCLDAGSFVIRLEFPDEEALGNVSEISLWAANVGSGSCEQFVAGIVSAESLSIRARLDLRYPPGERQTLAGVPTGEVMFLAGARNSSGATLLRGCALATIAAGPRNEVVIALSWVRRTRTPMATTSSTGPALTGTTATMRTAR